MKITNWGQTYKVRTNTSYLVVLNQTAFLAPLGHLSVGHGGCRDPYREELLKEVEKYFVCF